MRVWSFYVGKDAVSCSQPGWRRDARHIYGDLSRSGRLGLRAPKESGRRRYWNGLQPDRRGQHRWDYRLRAGPGVPLSTVVELYKEQGRAIMPRPFPQRVGLDLAIDLFARPRALRHGAAALRTTLTRAFGDTTLRQLYDRRSIALALTSVKLEQHCGWVFRTPHLPGSTHRDENHTVENSCIRRNS